MTRVEVITAILVTLLTIAFFLWVIAICGAMLSQPATSDRVNLRIATRQAVPVIHSDVPVSRGSSPIATIYMECTAYSPTVAQTDASPLITASGKKVYVGGIAADLDVLPFGSIVIIPNYNNGNPCIVIDTGGAIQGNKLDVFMWKTEDARQWGRRRNVRVQVLYIPRLP